MKKLIVLIMALVAAGAAASAQEYNLYFGGTHSHTSFSDGSLMIEDAFDTARNKGNCDFWYVTDHYQALFDVENLPEGTPPVKEWDYELDVAPKMTEDGKFIALVGWEWSDGDFGHMNVLFDSSEPPPVLMTGFYDQFVSYWLKKHPKSITGFNHPEWSEGRNLSNFRDFEFIPRIAKQTVYMEVSFVGEPPYYYRALDKGWWIAPLAAQDNHSPDWGLRPEFVALYAPELTEAALREAFLARRFYATTDRDLELSFLGNGEIMGSRMKAGKVNLEIGVSHKKDKVPKLVRLVTNGGEVLKEWAPEGPELKAEYETDIEAGKTRWFVVYAEMELVEGDAEPRFSISAPILVKGAK